MPRLGFPELVIILVIALIIFGPGKLPSLGKSVGETIKEFKKASTQLMNDNKAEAAVTAQESDGEVRTGESKS
ncbi:MAG: twin-arginine translocase TatA/TatE family subunit [Acetobacterium sp.]